MRLFFLLSFVLSSTAASAHGPNPGESPWHEFQLAPRLAERGQLGVNFGLSQLLLGGFNVAAEGRWGRWVLEYSHGMNLDYNRLGEGPLTDAEKALNLQIQSPWTTGAGIGMVVLDELYVGAEFKAHRYDVQRPTGETLDYTTVSIGPVIGWRYFIWRGLHANVYLRYWPNVWSSLEDDTHRFDDGETHVAKDLGVFGNVSLGWVFDLGG
jgi:hypothetical protein